MKINAAGAPLAPSAARRAAATGGAAFAPQTGAASAPTATARPVAAAGVGGLDALLALQSVDGPLERRRRAAARGGRLLDRLDGVKLALLGGGESKAALGGLMAAIAEERAQTGEAGLEGVLDAIETRAAVELAKWEMQAAPAR